MADPLLLLYRADWSQWSLSAKVIRRRDRRLSANLTERLVTDVRRRSGGLISFLATGRWATSPIGEADGTSDWTQTTQRLLVAPGGRYRFEPAPSLPSFTQSDGNEDDEPVRLIVSDGESCWVIRGNEADQSVADPEHPPIKHIVRPTWLMHQLQLTATGTTEVAGRAALKVLGTPRLPADHWGWRTALLDRVDIVIDSELGLVLRCESVFDGQLLSSVAVADLVIDPVAATDPASFRPEDDVEVEQNDIGPPESHLHWRGGDYEPDDDIDGRRIAANIARGAVYLAAKRLARPEPRSHEPPDGPDEDTEAAMPAARPRVPGPAPATPGSRTPLSDAVLRLITHTGMPPLQVTAQVHHWLDAALARHSLSALTAGSNMHEAPIASGFFGADEEGFSLLDSHRTARLTLAMPDRYRIDFEREDRPRHPLTMACDGGLLRKVYHNRVVVSPPLPLPSEFVRLVDPAWLLRDWPLSEAGEQTFDGRRAIQLIAERPPVRADRRSRWSDHTVLIAVAIDAELGIALQQVSYLDGKPVSRYEMREVMPYQASEPGDFGAGIAPDLPEFSTNGDPIGDLDLPPSARAVGQATTELVSGARSAFDWLANQARKVSGS